MGTFCIEDERELGNNVICEERFSAPSLPPSLILAESAPLFLVRRPLLYSRDETISTLTGSPERLRARSQRPISRRRDNDNHSAPRARVENVSGIRLIHDGCRAMFLSEGETSRVSRRGGTRDLFPLSRKVSRREAFELTTCALRARDPRR